MPAAPGSGARGGTWALVVGIERYDFAPRGRRAVEQAQAMAEWLGSPDGGGAAPEQMFVVLDRDATGNAIVDAVRRLVEAPAADDGRLFFYFAGEVTPLTGPDVEMRPVDAGEGGALRLGALRRHLSAAGHGEQFFVVDGVRGGDAPVGALGLGLVAPTAPPRPARQFVLCELSARHDDARPTLTEVVLRGLRGAARVPDPDTGGWAVGWNRLVGFVQHALRDAAPPDSQEVTSLADGDAIVARLPADSFPDEPIAGALDVADALDRPWVFDRVEEWLAQHADRALMITGPSGAGKTSLALQVREGHVDPRRHPMVAAIDYVHVRHSSDRSSLEPAQLLARLADRLRERSGAPAPPPGRDVVVRISTLGQWVLRTELLARMDALDDAIVRAVDTDDELQFAVLFRDLVEFVQRNGVPVSDDALVESDLILPPPDLRFKEARSEFTGEGVVPPIDWDAEIRAALQPWLDMPVPTRRPWQDTPGRSQTVVWIDGIDRANRPGEESIADLVARIAALELPVRFIASGETIPVGPPFSDAPVLELPETRRSLSRLSDSARAAVGRADGLRSLRDASVIEDLDVLATLTARPWGWTTQVMGSVKGGKGAALAALTADLQALVPAEMPGGEEPPPARLSPLSEGFERALQRAARHADALGSETIRSRHVFVGLLTNPESRAARWAADWLGVPADGLAAVMADATGEDAPLVEITALRIGPRTLGRREGAVRALALSPDGLQAVSCGDDGTVDVWDLASGRRVDKLHSDGPLTGVLVTADGAKIVAAGHRAVVAWEDGEPALHISVEAEVVGLVAGAESNRVLWVHADGSFHVADIDVASVARSTSFGGITGLAFEPHDARALILTDDAAVAAVDPASGARFVVLLPRGGPRAVALALAPDGRRAFIGSERTVSVWNLLTGRLEAELAGNSPARALSAHPDGRTVAVGRDDGSVTSWDADSGRGEFLGQHDGPVLAVAVTPDGARVLSGSADGTVRIWPMPVGEAAQRSGMLSPHAEALLGMARHANRVVPGGPLTQLHLLEALALHAESGLARLLSAGGEQALPRFLEALEIELERRRQSLTDDAGVPDLDPEPSVRRTLQRAAEMAAGRPVEPRDLVVALIADDSDTADAVAREVGLDPEQLRELVRGAPADADLGDLVRAVREQRRTFRLVLLGPTDPPRVGDEVELVAALLDDATDIGGLEVRAAAGAPDVTLLFDAPGFQLEQGGDSVTFALDGAEVDREVRVTLVALRPGPASVRATVFAGEQQLGAVEAAIDVTPLPAPPRAASRVHARPVPLPDALLEVRTVWNQDRSVATLQVRLQPVTGRTGLDHEVAGRTGPLHPGWARRARSLVAAALGDAAGAEVGDLDARLAAVGRWLHDELVPLEVREALTRVADYGATLQLVCDEDSWAPWELVHDGEGFLGDHLTVGRWPLELDAARPFEFPLGAVNVAHYEGVERPGRWAVLAGAPQAPPARTLEGGVFGELAAVEAMRAIHLVRRASPPAAGDAPARLDAALDTGDGGVDQARLSLRRGRPLVTLGYLAGGAAEATAVEHTWALPFLRARCSAFVGPQWTVSADVEAAFLAELYARLWQGVSLGTAFDAARAVARLAVPESPDWRSYLLFGDPLARPYRPVHGNGYAIVERIGADLEEPLAPGEPARFRATLSRTPPTWHEARLTDVAEDLALDEPVLQVVAGALEVEPPPPVRAFRTPAGDYRGWFTLTAPDGGEPAGTLAQVVFADGERPVHGVMFQIAVGAVQEAPA